MTPSKSASDIIQEEPSEIKKTSNIRAPSSYDLINTNQNEYIKPAQQRPHSSTSQTSAHTIYRNQQIRNYDAANLSKRLSTPIQNKISASFSRCKAVRQNAGC